MNSSDNNYGVLLYNQGWEELDDVITPYTQNGKIGKYIYCKNLEFLHNFVVLSFSKNQVGADVKDEMSIWIPTIYVKFVTHASDVDNVKIGFI